jgi:type IV fimbrial biogenesis protein FimT
VDNNDDFVIQVHKKPASYTVRVSNDKATPEAINTLTFNNQGFTKDGGRAFVTLCEPGNVVKYARGLNIERSGRTMKSRDSNNDGIHERVFDTGTSTAGTPTALSCS